MDKLRILDGRDVPNPEDLAMLMAMYSRSPASVDDHLEKIAKVGSGNFMKQFYVGYGHKSIGDCGDLAVFMEGISMLAAKAIQDNPLYNGQEASTRYMDFSTADFITANNTERERELIEAWRPLYLKALQELPEYLRSVYKLEYLLPVSAILDTDKGDLDKQYDKTIKAMAFDIARGLLPCGASTNVAWKAPISDCAKHTVYLQGHPLLEVANLGQSIYYEASKKEPHSFKFKMPELPNYADRISNYYFNPSGWPENPEVSITYRKREDASSAARRIRYFCSLNNIVMERNKPFMTWPKALDYLAMFNIEGLLDFASYRDLQRHRPGHHPVPIVTGEYGLHPWYLGQLSAVDNYLVDEVKELFDAIKVHSEHTDPAAAQYLFPMATQVPILLDWPIEQLVYVVELRTGVAVHPTLREFMGQTFAEAAKQMPVLLEVVFPDKRGHYENSKRGAQDIVAKETPTKMTAGDAIDKMLRR